MDFWETCAAEHYVETAFALRRSRRVRAGARSALDDRHTRLQKPEYLPKKSGRLSRASSRVAKPRMPRRRDASAAGWRSKMQERAGSTARGCPRAHCSPIRSFDTRLVRDAVRQGAGRTDRAQQPAARGGSSSLSVAAAAPAEPRQPRTPRQPQDAGGGPRRGSFSVADGTCVAASTERRQPRASGSLASAEHRQPRARATIVATAAERRRRATIAATAAERRRAAVAALARGPGRRRARR